MTRTVRLNYARASAVAPMVEARLTRTCPHDGARSQRPDRAAGPAARPPASADRSRRRCQSLACPQRGAVTADTITNSISITDVPSALTELEAVRAAASICASRR